MSHKDYYRKSSVEKKKSLVVGLKGIDTKTNWLVANRLSYSNFDFDLTQFSSQLRVEFCKGGWEEMAL
jgi:hypothetical protein